MRRIAKIVVGVGDPCDNQPLSDLIITDEQMIAE